MGMTESQRRSINELRAAGYAVTTFSPNEVSEKNRSILENRLVELGTEVLRDLGVIEDVCVRCGSDMDGEYCSDVTCIHSDWPQSINAEDLHELTLEQAEEKYGVKKRVRESV